MQPTDDGIQLRQYTEDHSNEAFAALVARHVNLVYSVALRCVGNPHQAEEITQAVFILLAKKAAQLRHDKALSSWLFQTTRLTASNFVRSETRRHRREQEAHVQTKLNQLGDDIWPQIAPLLDDAVAELNETDRHAIMLRFYDGRSLREVGAALGASEDAAEKRVSRAVERLREFFAKRGVTVGASGLVVALTTNAVQAAPVNLAVTISAAAITGTAVSTSTTIATTAKVIAMTTLQKTLITATVAVLAGAGIYEARQASQLRDQVQALQQLQASLTEQNQQSQQERDEATRQLARLREENAMLNRNTADLLKLRSEVTRLKNDTGASAAGGLAEASTSAAARSWLKRVDQLKQYVERNPAERIPEFEYLDDRGWLVVADAGLESDTFEKEDDYNRAMQSLRFQAESCFARHAQRALRKFAATTQVQFPSDLTQLGPFCDPNVLQTLTELYEIQPANLIPESERRHINAKFDWFITRKARVTSNTTSRLAIFPDGDAYWQSRP